MYNIGLSLVAFLVRLGAAFHRKLRLMRRGHRQTFHLLQERIDRSAQYIWFHAASLGEFEQARPLIESVKGEHPGYKILLTFFSPSGYEVRKDYPLADIVCYLPIDTKRNVLRFLDLAQPQMAIFIKYEFWYNYVHESFLRNIPVYLVSGLFRPDQIFFRKSRLQYGKMLQYYRHFFVQDEASAALLKKHQIHQVTVAGDTRIDRVIGIQKEAKQLPLIERFAENDGIVFVAGSSWAADEDIFIDYFNTHPVIKLIIAPHEIHESHLAEIEKKLQRPSLRYSQITEENVSEPHCLIIDSFGLLSSIYRYGQIGYIGGGFGAGIHNLAEAAVYGIPVIFGPKYTKFREAHGLISHGGGFTISHQSEFDRQMDYFMQEPSARIEAGEKARTYIFSNAGATQKIMQHLLL